LRTSQVLDAVHAAFQARTVGQVYDRNRVVDLVLTLRRQDRADAEAVANLWLSVPNPEARAGTIDPGAAAGRIQLRQVADVYLADGRFLVAREGGGRRSTVTCNVQGRDVESFAVEVERQLKALPLPDGVSVILGGEHEARRGAGRGVGEVSGGGGGGLLVLLWGGVGAGRPVPVALPDLPVRLVRGVSGRCLTG